MAVRGAIFGDIVGSRFEGHQCPNPNTCRFFTKHNRYTDDTVLTLAIKRWLDDGANGSTTKDYLREFYFNNQHRGYGSGFKMWVYGDPRFRPSFGNGSAMRVSAISDFARTLGEAENLARISALDSHNTSEGIIGATVIAAVGFLARTVKDKDRLLNYAGHYYPEILTTSHEELDYGWSATCAKSVPLAVRCFYDSTSFEDCIRKVLSHHCDADTVCAMAGGIAQNFYNVSDEYLDKFIMRYLSDELIGVLNANVPRR